MILFLFFKSNRNHLRPGCYLGLQDREKFHYHVCSSFQHWCIVCLLYKSMDGVKSQWVRLELTGAPLGRCSEMQSGGSITDKCTSTGEGQEAGRRQQGEDLRAVAVKAGDREQRMQDALQEHAQKDACGSHRVRACVLYACQEQMTAQRFLCCVSQVIWTTAHCIHGFHSLRNKQSWTKSLL